jgi:hypothetical protein
VRISTTLLLSLFVPACTPDPGGTDTAPGTDAGTGAGTTGTGGDVTGTTADPPTTSTTAAPTSGETTSDPGGSTGAGTTGGAVEGGLDRPADPVVLIGGRLPGLAAHAPGDLVGFARRDGAWVQIPIQVDERVRLDFCTVYAEELLGANAPCKTAQVIEALFYADPNTYTGPDTDATFDLDDELVFMARDAGDRTVPGDEPAGVVAGSGVEVELVDADATGWVYLFARDPNGGLTPDAGADLVSYDLVFDPAIDYLKDYPFIGDGSCGDAVCDPPILEDSMIKSERYERHFSARWVTDSLKITAPDSTGQDILDIAQNRFAPNICGRHVLTFSTAEGAFVANIDGPVRAIRSYLGANSGPLTQRTHLFYDRVETIHTFLRVHPIGAIMDLVDYAADAAGMSYYNEHNAAGVAIDGVPDPGFDAAAFTWELVSGPHGSVVSVIAPRFSQPLATSAYYEDDADEPTDQCSESNVLDHPDDIAFGTSGMWVTQAIPGTDPRNGDLDYLFIERTSYYEAPGLGFDAAAQLAARAKAPPQALARGFGGALGPACGDATCDADEAVTCPQDCSPIDGSCGDGLCDLWENSVNCPADCSTGAVGAACGDDLCDTGEHELNCAGDCWEPAYGPLVACLSQSCSVQTGACSDELPCVDRVVCTAECVADGGQIMTCANQCAMQIPATTEQAAFAQGVLACAQQNCV